MRFFYILSLIFICASSGRASTDTFAFKEGDILGESELAVDPSTAIFEAATSSRYGHVGVVLQQGADLVVYEEYPPAAEIVSINEFIERSHGHYSVIRKKVPLTSDQLVSVRIEAQMFVANHIGYNYFQTSNGTLFNCSEFARAVFARAHVDVGQKQTVGDMDLKAFSGYLWSMWQQDNSSVSLKDHVVTPNSVMQSSGWQWVSGSTDPQKKLSDKDLVSQWKQEQVLDSIGDEWGLSAAQVEKLANPN